MNYKLFLLANFFFAVVLSNYSLLLSNSFHKPSESYLLSSDTTGVNLLVPPHVVKGRDKYTTSVVTFLTSGNLENSTQPGIQSAIQGKATGVYVQGGSGKLGQIINVRIRGTSSIAGNNQPLYIIDGMPFTDLFPNFSQNEPVSILSFINPADIENIEIIRDASSAAYFGSMASNGAVIITTKKGQGGKTKFTFNTQLGISSPANKIGFLNRQQYLSLVEEGYNNVINLYGADAYDWMGWPGLDPPDSWPDILDIVFPYWRDSGNPNNLSLGPNTNWENQIFRKGFTQQYNLEARGGSEKFGFYTSLSWHNQESFIINHNFERISGRINIDFKPNEKLTFSIKLSPTRTRIFKIPQNRDIISPMIMAEFSPLEPLYIPGTKELNYLNGRTNPLIALDYFKSTSEFVNGLGNLSIQYNLAKNIHLTTELSGNLIQMEEALLQYYSFNNAYNENVSVNSIISHENYFITFMKDFRNSLNVRIKTGLSNSKFKNEVNISSPSIILSGLFDKKRNLLNYYITSSLNYRDKYYLETSGRIEGSSIFSESKRYKFFPHASASWVIIKDDQTRTSLLLNYLKFNLSFGMSGNDQIDVWGYSYLPNPELSWQIISHSNAGIDFTLLKNRLFGEFNYYIRKTKDAFVAIPIPSIFSYNYMISNAAEIKNQGFEFALSTENFIGKLRWITSLNISKNINKITDLKNLTYLLEENTRIIKNYPVGSFWMPIYAGPDPANGDALFYTDATKTATTSYLFAAQHQFAGDPNPEFYGGITNHITYKKWDLMFNFQFVYGNEILNHNFIRQANGLEWFDNQTIYYYENYWKKPGDKTKYPQPRFLEGNGWGISSMHLFDGSYIRLKDVTIGYNIKSESLSLFKITSMRIYLRGLNLLTFTKYPGWDPEASYHGVFSSFGNVNNITKQGYDYLNAPQPRTFTFGVNIGF